MWIEVKVKYTIVKPNGKATKKNETYLVRADACTDAESVIHKFISPVGVEIKSMRVSKITNVLGDQINDDCFWYKVTTAITSLSEETGAEKRTTVTELIRAENVLRALQLNSDQLFKCCTDYDVLKIEKTNIDDVLK